MKRRDEVLVGIFTTAAVIIFALGSIWLVRGGLSSGYPLYARFTWGQGLKVGQPVWLVGVTVGSIDDVALDPAGTVLLTLRISKKFHIPRGSTAQIMTNGFFGDMAVNLQPPAPVPNVPFYAPRDTLPTAVAQAGLQALTQRADTLSMALSAIALTARAQFVDSGGLRDVRRVLETSNRLVAQLTDVIRMQSNELQTTIATVRSRVAAVDSTQVDSTVRSLREASRNLADLTARMQTTTDRANALLARADSGNGTLALLLRDPGAYNDLRHLLGQLDSLAADIRKNPRKYINLKIF
jgi:phospholipid/cholesterol/gamma-HCH transport system substrate-binding protein